MIHMEPTKFNLDASLREMYKNSNMDLLDFYDSLSAAVKNIYDEENTPTSDPSTPVWTHPVEVDVEDIADLTWDEFFPLVLRWLFVNCIEGDILPELDVDMMEAFETETLNFLRECCQASAKAKQVEKILAKSSDSLEDKKDMVLNLISTIFGGEAK